MDCDSDILVQLWMRDALVSKTLKPPSVSAACWAFHVDVSVDAGDFSLACWGALRLTRTEDNE